MFMIVATLAAIAGASPSGSASAQAASLTVTIGGGESGYAVNLFLPDTVSVVEGTTLTWRNPWFEGHQVAFLGGTTAPAPGTPGASAPTNAGQLVDYQGVGFLSSGTLRRNDTFQARFPKAGIYQYLCLTHRGPPAQSGTVVVVPAGTPGISTQAQVDAAAAKTYADTLATLKAEAATLAKNAVQRVPNADGTATWRVLVTGGKVGTSDVQQFFPPTLAIAAGDTVVWEGRTPVPHPVAFLGGARALPAGANPQTPVAAPAAGYAGVGYVNTGSFGAGRPATTASMKFAAAGSYPFICALHFDQGMGGVVTVAASQAAPAPGKTGNAGLVERNGDTPLAVTLGLLGAAIMVVATARRVTGRPPRRD